ncbi:methyltransferase domain-containing protein [Adhaeribacter swui]|uniref:Methyltransferase domain-containing protein n=1 Tax=Adhaeribacter swui TaxID=2086471 RepID=A0A7G7G7P3_9BACT|nr:class I SAM-dependent methyltransferase [Adhaeribacter swui]QNF33177.1 methyltransferase domain-containing protein [Adhaeribacter swui]
MEQNVKPKSTVAEIRERFDQDVERFSNLETGQQSTVDAPISLELITEAVKYATLKASRLLDIGCGAGNYTLKLLSKIPNMHCTLVDLSQPMLQKAQERVSAATTGTVETKQVDVRDLDLPENFYCTILAGAVLHHLRTDEEWEAVYTKLYQTLKPGGTFWISDLITHEATPINKLMWDKYADYLEQLGGIAYKEKVLAYIEKEDSPRSLTYQLELLKKVGFRYTEVLHKNGCFAAFGGIK